METVKTQNKWLWREGDQGIVVTNVEMQPQYHITKDKEYPAVLGKIYIGYSAEFHYHNDANEPKKSISDHNSDRDGFESFWVILDKKEYNRRVNDLHTSLVNTLFEKYKHDLKELERQHSELWRHGNQ